MRTKARKLERKTRAAELDMEIMRAREANGLPVISPMLGLSPEKWECEFRDYLVALGDPRVADPEWLAARIREEQRRARWFVKWFDAWFEESADGFDFGKQKVRRRVGQPQHSRRTPEERQEALKAAHARRGLRGRNCGELLPPQGPDTRLFRLAQRLARGARSGRALSSSWAHCRDSSPHRLHRATFVENQVPPPTRMIRGAIPDTFCGFYRGVDPMVTSSRLNMTAR